MTESSDHRNGEIQPVLVMILRSTEGKFTDHREVLVIFLVETSHLRQRRSY